VIRTLRDLIDERSTLGQRYAVFVQFLILLSMISLAVETMPDLPLWGRNVLAYGELLIVIIFSAEYLLRIALAKRRLAFIFSFYGIVDLVAILPFYLATAVDLRSVRILRLMRLLRIVKLFRYNRAAKRLGHAFMAVKDELSLFFIMVIILLYLAAVGIYYFENTAQPDKFQSIIHSLWWAVATLTTVGYGDVYPVTAGGKFFTFVILTIGLGIVAVPTGLVASALTEARYESGNESAGEEM